MKKLSHTSLYQQYNKNTMPKLVSGFIRNKNKGFTLIEAMVSVAIVSVIMSVVFFDYATFNDNLALSAAAQELAVTIRQAQTYGLTVKEVSRDITSGGRFTSAYGVYFDENDPTHYYLFADLAGDKKYDVGLGCGSGPGNTECVEMFTLRNRVRVSNLYDETDSSPQGSNKMHVTFLRPNPDARIYFTVGTSEVGPSLTGKVVMTSAKGKTITVTVESTGQVLVGQIQ